MSYKVGDKFEIEIGNIFTDDDGNELYAIKGFNSLVFDEYGLAKFKKVEKEQPKPKAVKASELRKDTVVLCKNRNDDIACTRYFAGVIDKRLCAYADGHKSFETNGIISWKYITLVDGTVVLAE